jgi:hypothetical protein
MAAADRSEVAVERGQSHDPRLDDWKTELVPGRVSRPVAIGSKCIRAIPPSTDASSES